jgi:hypothetical protein
MSRQGDAGCYAKGGQLLGYGVFLVADEDDEEDELEEEGGDEAGDADNISPAGTVQEAGHNASE